MIKILEATSPFQLNGLYFIKTDSGKPVLVHKTSRKSIPITLQKLKTIKHEFVKENEMPEEPIVINGM